MIKARIYDFTLFAVSLIAAYLSGNILTDVNTFLLALFVFWLFSCMYYDLRVIDQNGQTSIDYGISYSLAFVIFTGPLGLLIYEAAYRVATYIYRKITKKAVKGDFLDIFYNIGSFTIAYSIAYYLYRLLAHSFQQIPFGFWILIILLAVLASIFTHIFLATSLLIMGDFKSIKVAVQWIITERNMSDLAKTAFTNGLLLLFLQNSLWEMLLCLFLLNYFVSRSYIVKSQSIQNKMERDKFEQMAYTDFLTNTSNRAFMDKKIAELNETDEEIGVVVCDIDKFKQVNDNFNHSVGDQVIQQFVQNLKAHLDDEDFLFRSGGDEFTMFLRNKSFEECVRLLEKIRNRIESNPAHTLYNNKKVSIPYTASFGLYYFKVGKQVLMEKGYNQADDLLLESKQLGRNRLSVKNGIK
ncbi:MAG: GGDEF domain-containing protein [Tuberibacillus sp.]